MNSDYKVVDGLSCVAYRLQVYVFVPRSTAAVSIDSKVAVAGQVQMFSDSMIGAAR